MSKVWKGGVILIMQEISFITIVFITSYCAYSAHTAGNSYWSYI